jgi:hypothetical protein
MDCDEPNLTSNEKTQPIQWTKRPTVALVVVGSLWPYEQNCHHLFLFWFCYNKEGDDNKTVNATSLYRTKHMIVNTHMV